MERLSDQMKAALTGTPGTGKSSAAALVTTIGVMSVRQLADDSGAASRADGVEPVEVDVEMVTRALAGIEGDLLIEGHLAHLLGVDLAVVLRCSPKILRERLAGRSYAEAKVRENIEAEAVDVILVEALEIVPTVCEIDTTRLSPAEVAESVEEILAGESEKYPVGHVDWSQEVLGWF